MEFLDEILSLLIILPDLMIICSQSNPVLINTHLYPQEMDLIVIIMDSSTDLNKRSSD